MPRQFSFRGDRLAFSCGIIILAAIAIAPDRGLRRRHPRAHPALLGRRVHRLHDQPVRHGPPLAARAQPRLALAARDQRGRRRPDRDRRWIVVTSVKFVDGAYLVVILIPILVAMMLFINRQYNALAARAARSATTSCSGAPPRGARRRPDPGHQPGRRPGRQRRPLDRRRRPRRLHHRRPRGGRRRSASDWERQMPGVPLVVVESPYRALVGPLAAYLDVLDAAWPPDKEAPITFVVLPEYVARRWWERILYNQSAKRLRARPARPAAHGRRQRPVPARGPRTGRGDRRSRRRRPGTTRAALTTSPCRWYRYRPCPTPIAPPSSAW